MLLATPNGRRHMYCMRASSVKSSLSCQRTESCLASADKTPTMSSMTIINMPQQQCFQLHNQRQTQHQEHGERHKSTTSQSLRLPDATLRRSNEAKNLESKRRVVKMVFVLVLEFFICWTPLYVINTLVMFNGAAMYEYIDYSSISLFQLLAYSSSCCNPITYCFMNAGFRRAFLDTFKGMQLRDLQFWRQRGKPDLSLSMPGNSITLANSVTIMSNNTLLDSPRL